MSINKKISPSTKTGAHSWLMLRISAIALIPLVIWIILSAIQIVKNPDTYMTFFFAYPFNAFMAILFIAFSLYHGSFGIKEVIEDYVGHKFKKHFYIKLVHFLSIVTGAAAIVAILRLHLIG